ncbi:GTP cyclohydrolase II [Pseudonocardiaceae bacterium YIM PH 21723]|nr:GTP cyclohydrolase II [Pseudonocardiaceae bacterium YIM PH 21723]
MYGEETVPSERTRVKIKFAREAAGEAELVTFNGLADSAEHVAIVFEPVGVVPQVRVHSECFTGDIFGSMRCDCGPQLDEAIREFGESGGILLYLRQEGRGIGLYNKIDAYALQDQNLDTYEANLKLGRGADERDYLVAAQMLRALGHETIRLTTNNPDKVSQLRTHGIDVTEVRPTGVYVNPSNRAYLEAKVRTTGHTLHVA